jgi:hypothetical protein
MEQCIFIDLIRSNRGQLWKGKQNKNSEEKIEVNCNNVNFEVPELQKNSKNNP